MKTNHPIARDVQIQVGQLWESEHGTLYRIKEVRSEEGPDGELHWAIIGYAVSQLIACNPDHCDPSSFCLDIENFKDTVAMCLTQYNYQ